MWIWKYWVSELRLQIEILDVCSANLGSWRRNVAIDQRLDLSPSGYG